MGDLRDNFAENGPLSVEDAETYAWQLEMPGFGAAEQAVLRNATALVSRVGGLGGPVAQALAAAGIGKLVLAHGGNLREDDLNRQILMSRNWLGRSRVECARETLRRFNPRIAVEAVDSNVTPENAAELVGKADLVFDCAPLFEERLLMNAACVAQDTPLVDCAMFGWEGQVIPIVPGKTPCLACLYPETPPHWKRRFPVIGAVSAVIGNLGVIEGIKLLAGMEGSRAGCLVHIDTRTMGMRTVKLKRRVDCVVCGEGGKVNGQGSTG